MIINNNSVAIFDVDGTLIDSMGLWPSAADAWLSQRSLAMDVDMKAYYMANGLGASCRLLAQRFPSLGSVDEISYEVSMTQRKPYELSAGPIPGALEFLKALKGHGTRLCILTANYRELIMPALDRLGMTDLFESIMLTVELGVTKRDHSAFLYACKLMNCRPQECIMFEDRAWSLGNAIELGMKAVGIYSQSTIAQKSRLEALGCQVIDDYRKLELSFA
ncbi:MAG: HAD family hydrolase [Sphaerochaetaceae bacterium]|jgi:HAD superfamily hydrolase (TIGR01509 family)|nr:HAD family hydrolase [Sphaerochaetaceae bacterium]